MTAQILTDWPIILEAGPHLAGGKAWNLARLARYGFDVPAGMVVPVASFQQWLENSQLEAALLDASQLVEPERSAVLSGLQQQLLTHAVGEDLLSALGRHLTSPPWRGMPLAVRSSAPQEDSAHASFAGIYSSILNVQDLDALDRAIRTVWASLWSPAAVAYRKRFGLAHDCASMAVLIMPLVPAVASGIAFTCDPMSGREDRLVIHANWGLGESLVGGLAVGDEIILEEDFGDESLTLISTVTGSKSVSVVPSSGGGTQTRAAPHKAAETTVLNADQALVLGEQLRLAADALDYARPVFDLEWAYDGRRFWLLQARPITVRNRYSYPGLAGQPNIWSNGNTRDTMPDPLSPLDWSLARRMVDSLLEQAHKLAGFPLPPGLQRAGLFHGRLYLNLSLIQWEGYAAFGMKPDALNRMLGGHQPEIHVTPLNWRQRLIQASRMLRFMLRAPVRRRAGRRAQAQAIVTAKSWLCAPLPETDIGFAAMLREQARHVRCDYALQFLQGSGGVSVSLLLDILEAHLPGESYALAAALLAGGVPSVTAQQGYDLVDLARLAMRDEPARRWLETRHREGGDWRALPADSPFRQSFESFIERYGHRGIYESYLRNPRWRERPGYLLDNLQALAQTDLEALAATRQATATVAMARVRNALPWWQRPLLKSLLRSANLQSNDREAARSALVAYSEPGRRTMPAIGARWVERGWLADPNDIFFLLGEEIVDALEGKLDGTGLAARVEDRRIQFDAWMTETPADVILEDAGKVFIPEAAKESIRMEGQDCFIGVAVGSGCATGKARLLRSPEEGVRLGNGDILVVPSTDPAWTPLFLRAGGLVMETGGYLSHGAIVAREFGIPAVVNLPGILHHLQDGDVVEVDGGRGMVRRLRQ